MYRHTFYLIDGTEKVSHSESAELGYMSFGREVAFIAYEDGLRYTIPFFSVGYIETEEVEDEE